MKTQFVCLEGGSHGCAEDFGGYTGWQELLEAYDSLILQKIRRRRYLGSKSKSAEETRRNSWRKEVEMG